MGVLACNSKFGVENKGKIVGVTRSLGQCERPRGWEGPQQAPHTVLEAILGI